MREDINPIIKMDYPDPDVIRVGDVYYMVSTTMYFMPGGAILQSYDLVNWELVGYIFDTLDDTPAERMELEQTEYAGGMWAPSIVYEKDRFYVFFMSHSGKKNYLFEAESIKGPWHKRVVEGEYHDASVLFDNGSCYLVYGNTEIRLTELNSELTGPKKGGLDRVIVKDKKGMALGYEGSHIKKIGKNYYLFLINWPKDGIRTESCFKSDSLEGEFKGGVVLSDTRGIEGRGVAQGGIVDTPDGKWYSILFQDMGAAGRIPVLVPITWKDDFPVFGTEGKIPAKFEVPKGKRNLLRPLYTSDKFIPKGNDPADKSLSLCWQWNHSPDNRLWRLLPAGGLEIKTGKISINPTQARNTLTQRMLWPACTAWVTIDADKLNDGDFAGLCALQSNYAMVGIKKEHSVSYLVVTVAANGGRKSMGGADYMPCEIVEKIRLNSAEATVGIHADFSGGKDIAEFMYMHKKKASKVGKPHAMSFSLAHFTGNRFGLCCYSTREIGGSCVFKNFEYLPE